MSRANFIKTIKESIHNRNFTLLLRPFLSSIHRYKLKRFYYINLVKSYFFNSLDAIDYNIITPSYKIEFNKNERIFLDEKISCEKYMDKLETQREIFSCVLNNVKFYGMSGGISYENKAIVESFFSLNRLKKIICIDSLFYKHKYMKGTYTSIMHLEWAKKNIFHWIIDCLPRLYALTRIDESNINLIYNKDIDKNQLEIINFFLDNRFKLIPIDSKEIWLIERYIFPSFATNRCSGYMPMKYLNFIKQGIINGYQIKTNEKKNRIYVSRKKVRKRKLLNEEEFYQLLKKYNFRRIFPEDLTFKEQVRIFNSAEVIISVHGAGLTNIIFSENLKVIELFPPNFIRTHYFMLSKALGFKYKYGIGYDVDNQLNFRVDLLKVENIIKILLEE